MSASSRQGRFLFLTAAFAAPVAAQEPPAGEETVIVVTGAGLPETPSEPAYGTQVIDRERLVTSSSGRIEDSLTSVAGFQQFRRSDSRSANPSAQGATLRALGGNASSRALVLLDGVPLADPFFGYIPFSAIAPERLASARVTRGGGSGPFGAGALAGTIELASAGYADLGPASAAAFANDRGDTEASAVLATQLGEGFASLSGRWDRGNGFWTTPLAQRVPGSVRASFDAWSAEARAVAPLGKALELQARMSAWRDDRTLRFAGADSSMEGEDASIRLVGRGDWQFDVLGYIQSRNFTNIVVSSTAFVPTLDQRNTPATGLGGKLELRPPVGPDSVVRLGLDYRRASGTLYEDAISTVTGAVTERRTAGGTNSDLGLFAEIDRTLGPVVLTGGLRADHFKIRKGFYRAVAANGMTVSDARYPDRSGWDISMRGGAALEAGGGLRLRAAGYTGLRLPTLNELYRPFVVFPVVTRANAALRNERLEGFEAGVDYAPSPSLEIALTAFDNRVRNAVANVTIGANLRERQNIDAIRARGIEAGTRLSVGALQFDSSLAWTAAEARGSGPASALMGKRPAQIPQFAASTTLAWKPSDRWLLSTTLRHVGAQFEDDLESDVLPAATTLDVYAQLPLGKRLSLVVRGENLFDETVVTRNQGGSIDLGTPRTVWLGIKVGG